MNQQAFESIGKDKEPCKLWTGSYRHVGFEINNFSAYNKISQPTGSWAHYLLLPLEQLPEDIRERFWLKGKFLSDNSRMWTYDYCGEPLIANLDWHADCTYYHQYGGREKNEPRRVKIGCDYQHLWDNHQVYSLKSVCRDVEKTIDSLWRAVPNLMVRCSWGGEYSVESECIKEGNNIYSKAGYKRMKEYYKSKEDD